MKHTASNLPASKYLMCFDISPQESQIWDLAGFLEREWGLHSLRWIAPYLQSGPGVVFPSREVDVLLRDPIKY